ncbi:hypothetical protein A2Y83_03575 [Candidatus Falkowbacteria bacterium RBG_13_39_14]|uniref:Uncharacterized protein n=1 Tax=Candidatus Falkowbacteria bacterium RBG_13_39_14 TaxID=1797985 RepID=A0A1F5S7D7_9BACT|nr:MAG: hypothetical protein A2Y83_03575 [Candidatus Falkowbacteria bacterium RBG_13_39_14]
MIAAHPPSVSRSKWEIPIPIFPSTSLQMLLFARQGAGLPEREPWCARVAILPSTTVSPYSASTVAVAGKTDRAADRAEGLLLKKICFEFISNSFLPIGQNFSSYLKLIFYQHASRMRVLIIPEMGFL